MGSFHLSGLNWDDLRVVQAVCSTGTYIRAARSLQLNETTVSRRIHRLETELGVVLFEAVNGERAPTEACRAIMSSLDKMDDCASDISRMLRNADYATRKLRLTTISLLAEHFLAPNLPGLLSLLPNLSLSIDTSDKNVDMSRWEADFAIRLGRPKHGTFLMRRIGTLEFSLVRPIVSRNPEAPIVAYPESMTNTPEMRTLLEREAGRPVRLETSNLEVMRRFLETGKGIGVLPNMMLGILRENPAMIVQPLSVEREIWLLSQPHLRDDALAKTVSQWCLDLFSAKP